MFLDESGAKTNMTRRYGRAYRGRRVRDRAPSGHWETTTMLSSIRADGTQASLSVCGATDALIFREYVRQVLAPSLRPGDIVIMDNLSAHKDEAALRLIEEAGASVEFLPPYSPDLNPIEKMWSKVKAVLRQLKARTQQDLEQAIGQALATVTPQDALAWFKSCGYSIC